MTIFPIFHGISQFVCVQNCIVAMFINLLIRPRPNLSHLSTSDIVLLIEQTCLFSCQLERYYLPLTFIYTKHSCLGFVIKDIALILDRIESMLEVNFCPKSVSGWNVYRLSQKNELTLPYHLSCYASLPNLYLSCCEALCMLLTIDRGNTNLKHFRMKINSPF